jgi:peroxiredoxin
MFRDARQLRQEDCRFYGISRDSRFTHKAFKESAHLKHDLLAERT